MQPCPSRDALCSGFLLPLRAQTEAEKTMSKCALRLFLDGEVYLFISFAYGCGRVHLCTRLWWPGVDDGCLLILLFLYLSCLPGSFLPRVGAK